MAEKTVDVLLEQGSGGEDRILTYSIPASLEGKIQPGTRVVVPLGRRRVAGVVLELDAGDCVRGLRPIYAVLGGGPVLDEARTDLARWMATRYFGRLCDAWRLFLPPGTARRGGVRIGLAASSEEVRRRLERFILPQGEAGRLVSAVMGLSKGDRSPAHLQGILGPLYRQIEIMLGEGYLVLREPWQRRTPSARQVPFVRLTGKSPDRATPKQRRVMAYLEDKPGRAASRAELSAACGVGRSVIDRLLAGGYLDRDDRLSRRIPLERRLISSDRPPVLNAAQEAAVSWVRGRLGAGGRMLLHGVTGSGKTEVYLRSLALAAESGRTGLLLVPEIGLTPQTVERVVARFGERVAVLHSRLSVGERHDEWERVQQGEVDVVVGPRSALFAPLERPGLIILDEEHDQAYKQEDGLRYQTREVAERLQSLAGSVLILGSATPSLEAMAECERGESAYFALRERPGGRPLPPVELVDLRREMKAGRRGVLSMRLKEALAAALDAGEQAILLLNRRGYATFVICRECGHVMRCPHCDVSLTYHRGQTVLVCHYCGYMEKAPDICPGCRGRYIKYFGLGTERLVEEVEGVFPSARVARMDQDAMAHKGAHQEVYRSLRRGEVDILIGTQMVAKGLDLPQVTLVGVVAADANLNRPDFRAAERTFQLLTQVAGRAGRGDSPGRVIIQTYNPGHYSLVHAAGHDFHGFYRQELEARQTEGYPPFTEMIRFGLTGHDETATQKAADELAALLRHLPAGAGQAGKDAAHGGGIEILGPSPALVKRVEDRFRYHLLLKAPNIEPFQPALEKALLDFRRSSRGSGVALTVDVNPNTVL